MLSKVKNIHFIGIGGIGMSSLALILLDRGFHISGSDLRRSDLTEKIKKKGGRIFVGHQISNIPEKTELVVYSSSIPKNNPEIVKAKRKKLPLLHRSDIVAQLLNSKLGIAITGAHGKTTTTALSALLLTKAGFDPTVVIGGEVDFFKGNWRNGQGDFVICEADESDGTFLNLTPAYAVLTNIDEEHLDYYKDLRGVLKANKAFMKNIKEDGCLITSCDDPNIKQLLKRYKRRFLTYSLFEGTGADIYPKDIRMERLHSSFKAVWQGKDLGFFKLNIPGKHNVENSLAAILLGLQLGIDIDVIKAALLLYTGALRRFQIKGNINDIMIVEDYAHHPAEISATISTCRNWPGRRVIGVFQPHRYTRTKFLKKEFGKSFLELDELILTDIYSASEKPISGVSTKIIYDEAIKNGQQNIRLIKKEKILPHLLKTLRPNDTVLVLGAGDIGELSDELVKRLEHKR